MTWLVEFFNLLHEWIPVPSGRSHFMTAREGQIMLLIARQGDRTTAIRLDAQDFDRSPAVVANTVIMLLRQEVS